MVCPLSVFLSYNSASVKKWLGFPLERISISKKGKNLKMHAALISKTLNKNIKIATCKIHDEKKNNSDCMRKGESSNALNISVIWQDKIAQRSHSSKESEQGSCWPWLHSTTPRCHTMCCYKEYPCCYKELFKTFSVKMLLYLAVYKIWTCSSNVISKSKICGPYSGKNTIYQNIYLSKYLKFDHKMQ